MGLSLGVYINRHRFAHKYVYREMKDRKKLNKELKGLKSKQTTIYALMCSLGFDQRLFKTCGANWAMELKDVVL